MTALATAKAAIESLHMELDAAASPPEAFAALDALEAFVDAPPELPTTEPELKALLLAVAERIAELPPDDADEHLTTYVLLIGTASEPGPEPSTIDSFQYLRGYVAIEGRMINALLDDKPEIAGAAIRSLFASM